MATVHCVIGSLRAGAKGAAALLPGTTAEAAETLASGGASTASTIAAGSTDAPARFWSITAVGGNVWVKFGTAPVAASGQDWLVLDGQTREFAATAGDKVAVIDT